ncbi:hypothetical protein Vretifemale_5407, partial [Volvox reticuliferus]
MHEDTITNDHDLYRTMMSSAPPPLRLPSRPPPPVRPVQHHRPDPKLLGLFKDKALATVTCCHEHYDSAFQHLAPQTAAVRGARTDDILSRPSTRSREACEGTESACCMQAQTICAPNPVFLAASSREP